VNEPSGSASGRLSLLIGLSKRALYEPQSPIREPGRGERYVFGALWGTDGMLWQMRSSTRERSRRHVASLFLAPSNTWRKRTSKYKHWFL
jgi:hypothetical protein